MAGVLSRLLALLAHGAAVERTQCQLSGSPRVPRVYSSTPVLSEPGIRRENPGPEVDPAA